MWLMFKEKTFFTWPFASIIFFCNEYEIALSWVAQIKYIGFELRTSLLKYTFSVSGLAGDGGNPWANIFFTGSGQSWHPAATRSDVNLKSKVVSVLKTGFM